MIVGFVGTPGSGKSYDGVRKILDNLQLNRTVYTNIDGLDQPKCREYIRAKYGYSEYFLEKNLKHLTNEEAQEFWNHCPPGSFILIDEVHKLFSNRNWSSDENKQFTEWASTHRHDGFDLVLITQDIEKVDKHARSLIEFTYLYRKINYFGSAVKNKYKVYTFEGDNHKSKPLVTQTRSYDHTIFPCYSSYSHEAVKELGFMTGVNILKHPVFYAIPVVFALTIYFISQSSIVQGRAFDYAPEKEKEIQVKKYENKKPKVVVESVPAVKEIAVPVEVVDPLSVIKAYRHSSGRMIYTNNNIYPRDTVFERVIK